MPWGLRDALMKRNEASAIDWSRTRAFTLPTDLEGCIRINLRGREPEDIVAPGAEYDALCEELTAALLVRRDARTGERAVERLVRRDRELPGARGECLPALIVVWSEGRPLEAVRSPAVGTIEAPSPDERTGTHRAPGFVVACGAGFGGGYWGWRRRLWSWEGLGSDCLMDAARVRKHRTNPRLFPIPGTEGGSETPRT